MVAVAREAFVGVRVTAELEEGVGCESSGLFGVLLDPQAGEEEGGGGLLLVQDVDHGVIVERCHLVRSELGDHRSGEVGVERERHHW